MMAKKERFPRRHSTGFAPNHESEGSGSSGRVDTEITASEDSNFPKRKCINLNYSSRDGFAVPVQILPLYKLSPSERRDLVLRLKSELEKIQLLEKKVELHRANASTVSSSSDILSCSNVRNVPLVGKMNKSSAKNLAKNSLSGKKLNPQVQKARGWNRGTSGRFESANQRTSVPTESNAILMRQCDDLLKKLMSHQFGGIFTKPVDVVKYNVPDYFSVIKHPMDLGTIEKKISNFEYSNPVDFAADVRLTFSNSMTYNPPGHDVHYMADTINKFFEVRWKAIEKKIPVIDSQPKPDKPSIPEEREVIKPIPPSKKRNLNQTQHVMPEPNKCLMTLEEKHKLSRELEATLEDLPENIIDFLREKSSNGRECEDDEIEIEIDIDDLSNDALFKLRRLLDDHLQKMLQNQTNAEPCEIELPNESGLKYSSMQKDKGNEPIDEDVDIVGNEFPVSSCPPIEFEKDAIQRNNKCIDSDSDSGSSESESAFAKGSTPVKPLKENSLHEAGLDERAGADDLVDGNQSISGLDQLEQNSQQKLSSVESDSRQDGESAPTERQVSPEKLYRAALLKNRFADTILKAREKTLSQGEKGDHEKLHRKREELEIQRRKEKARLQAEAQAAEEARKQAEAEAAAEAKRKRELEREAARQALLKMEKTVELNENSQFLEDLEMLRTAPPDLLPNSVDETSPDRSQDGLGSFKFGGGTNPLEQLGLYMKLDEEEEEGEPPGVPEIANDVEEGEID